MDRELLILDSQDFLVPLIPAITAAGWQVQHTQSLAQAAELIDKHSFPVGLAYVPLPDHLSNDPRQQQLFPEHGATEWIAILTNELLNQKEICQQLSGTIYDYHTLPVDFDRLMQTLGHAYGIANLNHIYSYHQELETIGDEDTMMVGRSSIMQELFKNIRKVASVDAPVLIFGESGTGKELAAKAIHEHSNRAKGPFVAVNCGALPANLIQSELFGHEKGAFTGAFARKIGSIEAANHGTLFLDEISELPLELQVNLLRFLQEKTIKRVGDTVDHAVDVRVIAATNVNLENAVSQNKFREDLYYRIHVLSLNTPALRERGDDIELLAYYFFKQFSDEKNVRVKGFSPAGMHLIRTHHWDGNVRELINRIRSAMVMCEKRLITPFDLGLERRNHQRHVQTLEQAREQAEKTAILTALRMHRGKVAKAARELGTSRVTLYRLMKKFGLEEHGCEEQ